MKPQKAWAIKNRLGKLLIWSVTSEANLSKTVFINHWDGEFADWKEAKKCGYRCVRVEIREINKEKRK